MGLVATFQNPKYVVEQTGFGTWRTFEHKQGPPYRQFVSHAAIWGIPLVCIAGGLCPRTGKMAVAEGVIAIGQRAAGWISIGQFARGYISIGQFATGRIAAIGQFAIAPICIGQFSIGVAAIGQMGIAGAGIFQSGVTFFGGIGQQIFDAMTLSSWFA